MTEHDKIWVELDVEQDPDNKTERIQEVIESCIKIPCVKNVSKITYQRDIEKITLTLIEE